MKFDPKWLQITECTIEEIQRCQDAVETVSFSTGLIVDANNVMYRLAFALSKDISSAQDLLCAFVERVDKVASTLSADLTVCCIDSGVTLRRSMLGADKKPSKTPEQEVVIDLAREALRLLKSPAPERKWLNPVYMDGYEADDLCAAFAVSGLCIYTVIYSNDSDLYQVTNGNTVVQLSPANGCFLSSNIPPQMVAAVKALTGDTSDGVEGLKQTNLSLNGGASKVGGVGPAIALKILNGEITLDISREDTRRIRNNIALTSLPFPGSFLILQDCEALIKRVVDLASELSDSEYDQDEDLPF